MAVSHSIEVMGVWKKLWQAQAADDAGHLLLFKRSPICPVSYAAEQQFDALIETLAEHPALGFYKVNVIRERSISMQIAADTGVQHQSPQVLLMGPRQTVLWHASHGSISGTAMKQLLETVTSR